MANQLPAHVRPYFERLLHLTRTRTAATTVLSLHCHLIKINLISLTPLANLLTSFYSKSSLSTLALQTFSQITFKDTVSYNSLINASQVPNFKTFDLINRMLGDGVCPNSHTFAGVCTKVADLGEGEQAHCLAVKFGEFGNVFVGSSVVNMYCKLGDLVGARKAFDRMPDRNSVSWAAMISGYATRRVAPEAVEMFKSMMWQSKEGVNEFVVTSVLSALSLPELVLSGKQVHCLAVKNGLLSIVSVGNAIVTMYGKCGALDDSPTWSIS